MWRAATSLASLRRPLLGAMALAAATASTEARADGVIAGSDLVPVEQRIAIAPGIDRTTTWTSLRFDGPGGTLALVVPVKAGAALDYASRAFFEALEDGTAVRVVPPDQKPSLCPGDAAHATFSVEADLEGQKPLDPDQLTVLPGSVDVQAWAVQQGLIIDPMLVAGMNAVDDAETSFAVLRFTAPAGPAVTRTLRVVSPGTSASLPLVLSVAGASDLRITTWELGAQRARLSGTEVAIDVDGLAFEAGKDTSNYRSLMDAVLSDPTRYVVEASSHFALASSVSLFDGTASIPAVTDAYFERAALAGDATDDAAGCTFKAATALAQTATFGHACPAGNVGVVEPPATCTSAPGPLDVAALECGGITDDFAIAFSDLDANDVWVTRSVFRLAPKQAGISASVTFGPAATVEPVLEATSNDTHGCSTGSSTGSGPPPSTSGGGTVQVPIYQHEGCDCSGNYVLIGYEDVSDGTDAPAAFYDDGSDGCSSSDESLYTNAPGDDCAYDPAESADTSGCDCSSDADASGCDDSGDYGDDCASGAGDSCDAGSDACSGFDASSCDCAVAKSPSKSSSTSGLRPKHRRVNTLRLSPIVMGLAILLIPLRRRRRSATAPTPGRLRTLFRSASAWRARRT